MPLKFGKGSSTTEGVALGTDSVLEEFSGDGIDGGSTGTSARKEQVRPVCEHRLHEGRVSSHLTRRTLHTLQPSLDLA